ncbi:ATP-binding cassette domain-containing protein [Rhizobium deserti]|uniref:ATP-binding cassette domain-containing protein n=1 Tax=Rhizobium deserti TaxID=2547961 RepID=A0A4R5UHY8_9HYPH|nr:ATP-binding cassette domain-containing protein [Rhizobium deserti]TDK35594.1 ATP-binding cassette domain-containing protein [Rhizobium deserti]
MLSLQVEELRISFPGLAAPVLLIDRLYIDAGQRVAITGGSGSGKSTLINVVTGLERAQAGRVLWNGQDIARLAETTRDRWRAEHVGLVMQDFHLFPGLSAVENVLLPARLARAAGADVVTHAHELLQAVSLARPDQRIDSMSRGEMQRVAIARALLRRPGVIIADEPTASLDAEAGEAVGNLLLHLAAQTGATLIVVSHDQRLINRLDRRIALQGGRIVADRAAGEVAA